MRAARAPGIRRLARARLPVLTAFCSFVFHASATSFASGSSGLGADSKAWMERRTVRICSAGLHLSFKMSRQMRPSRSMFG